MTRNKYILGTCIFALALAGYIYYSHADNRASIEQPEPSSSPTQGENGSIPVSPEELKELQKDTSAPDWLKDAESCTRVAGSSKVFCKLKGE